VNGVWEGKEKADHWWPILRRKFSRKLRKLLEARKKEGDGTKKVDD